MQLHHLRQEQGENQGTIQSLQDELKRERDRGATVLATVETLRDELRRERDRTERNEKATTNGEHRELLKQLQQTSAALEATQQSQRTVATGEQWELAKQLQETSVALRSAQENQKTVAKDAAATISELKQSYTKRIENLNAQWEKESEQHATTKAYLKKSIHTLELKSIECKRLKRRARDVEKKCQGLIALVQQQRDLLAEKGKTQQRAIQALSEADGRAHRAEAELAQCQAQLRLGKSHMQEWVYTEGQQLKAQTGKLQAEVDAARACNESYTETTQALIERLAKMETEMQKLHAHVKETDSKHGRTVEELSHLRAANEALGSEKEQLESAKEQLESDKEQLSSRVESLAGDLKELARHREEDQKRAQARRDLLAGFIDPASPGRVSGLAPTAGL